LFQHIRPAIKEARGDLDLAVRLNVRNQAQILAEASPVIAKMIKQGDLLVAGGVYDLQTGRVSPVDVEME
jgi:carbonic anhydrase